MPKKPDDNKKPTNIVQVASIIALVALTFIDAKYEEFQVSFIVYGILGGLLLGVTNIRNLLK